MNHLERQFLPTPGWDERKAHRATRQQLLVMLVIVAALAMLSSQLWWSRVFPPDTFDPPRFTGLTPATPAQAGELERVALEYREVSIDARLTNDTADLTTVLYNDPAVDVWNECKAWLDDYEQQIAERLARAAGPIGAERGMLSCEVGSVIQQWEYATVRATADAGKPYPDGSYTPATFMRWQVGHRVIQQTWFHKPMISGDGQHAMIAESFYPVPDAPTYLRYAFTNIDGRWYISAMWSDCRKDTPCA